MVEITTLATRVPVAFPHGHVIAAARVEAQPIEHLAICEACWDQPSALAIGSCWDRPSAFAGIDRRLLPLALAGIDRRLLLGSTVGSCWDRP
jgi:hypothetical protein